MADVFRPDADPALGGAAWASSRAFVLQDCLNIRSDIATAGADRNLGGHALANVASLKLNPATLPGSPVAGQWAVDASNVPWFYNGTAWVSFAAATQPTWNALSLSNSWVNVGGSNQVAQYCIDALGWVHVRGDIKSGTSADGTTLFTLPSGYRPPASMAYAVAAAFRAGPENVPQVNISSGGVATVYGLSSNSYLHIGPISFATF